MDTREQNAINALGNIGRELEQLCRIFPAVENSAAECSAQFTQDDQFEVAEILAWRHRGNGQREFLVRWEDYPPDNDEWVPENNMSCAEHIESFFAKNPDEYLECVVKNNNQDDDNITESGSDEQEEVRRPPITRTLKCIVCHNEFSILLAPNMPRMRAFVCSKECATKNAEEDE